VVRAIERAKTVDDEAVFEDIKAALAGLRRHDRSDRRLFIVGVCFGGRFAVRAAAENLVDGAAAWHGGGLDKMVDLAETITVPLALHFGSSDMYIPLGTVGRISTALAPKDNVTVDVHTDAQHGFTEIGSRDYDGAADRAAMLRLADIIRNVPSIIPD